ncbi:hypothetical protein MTYM_00919 [Methylococcales bacterium]|nr:hypothetical protein MTYM_00919 [Methylococcales bacterium]
MDEKIPNDVRITIRSSFSYAFRNTIRLHRNAMKNYKKVHGDPLFCVFLPATVSTPLF